MAVDFDGGYTATVGVIGRSEGQRDKRCGRKELVTDGVGKVPLLVGADATVVVHKEDGLVQKNASVEELRKPTGSNERAVKPTTWTSIIERDSNLHILEGKQHWRWMCSWQREQRLQEGRCRRTGVEVVVYCRWGKRDLRSSGCPGGWR
ncbi:hypothetical protein B296_00041541 [Ensete ventricosum]|uniref:Uncharacterized protein n=1 Tax=Ensete ventricosum TaxID=4639 RepID=A0A426Z208_ENSVE|nr:hypothetical protein B296_00041541 [Ensete ventricosum]